MTWADITFDAWAAKLAGVAGALVSLKFLNGTWPERISTAVLGAIASYYAAPWIAAISGLPSTLAGFLCGLFGMAIMSRLWEWLQSTPIGPVWQILLDWLRRVLPGTGGSSGGEPK